MADAPRIEVVPLRDLQPLDDNPNQGSERSDALLRASLRDYDFFTPGVLDRDRTVLAGNHRRDVALEQGIEDAILIHTTGKQAVFVVRDDMDADSPDPAVRDRTREAIYMDNWSGMHVKLEAVVVEKDIKAGLNLAKMMTRKEMTRIGVQLDKPTGLEESDAPTAEPSAAQQEFGVELGDVWQLGSHLIACDDCTDPEMWQRITPGIPNLCVTSPPYGVGKDYEAENSFDDWLSLIARSCASIRQLRCPLFCVNLGDKHTGNDGWELHTYANVVEILAKQQFQLIGTRMWLKQPAWSQNPYWRNSYKPVDEFEYIGFFASEKPKFVSRLTDEENNEWGYRAVWEIPSVSRNDVHTAMFPIELPMRCIRLLTDPGDLVIEPFAGSGTTIIACEATGRHCVATEILPQYVAVALERYRNATKKEPVRIHQR
jgi:DNA modification methylase